MDNIHENDLVALLIDKPKAGLYRGDVGTVVQVFESTANHRAGLFIEFVDETWKVRTEINIADHTQIVKLRIKLDLAAA